MWVRGRHLDGSAIVHGAVLGQARDERRAVVQVDEAEALGSLLLVTQQAHVLDGALVLEDGPDVALRQRVVQPADEGLIR